MLIKKTYENDWHHILMTVAMYTDRSVFAEAGFNPTEVNDHKSKGHDRERQHLHLLIANRKIMKPSVLSIQPRREKKDEKNQESSSKTSATIMPPPATTLPFSHLNDVHIITCKIRTKIVRLHLYDLPHAHQVEFLKMNYGI